MKKTLLCMTLVAASGGVFADASIDFSGNVKLAVTSGNSGTSPLFGKTGKDWTVNDESSQFWVVGKKDIEGDNYGKFTLGSLFDASNGQLVGGNSLWFLEATLTIGGRWGEVYAGRSVTPLFMTAIQADPWLWDSGLGQLNWDIQQANYKPTSFLRTNSTVGYKSPNVNGWSAWVAVAPAVDAVNGIDAGASVSYSKDALWVSLATDQHKSKASGSELTNRNVTLAGAYNFGVVRPMVLLSSSDIDGRSYKGYTVAATFPFGKDLLKVGMGSLSDWDTTTIAKEAATKYSIGYDHQLFKRTKLFVNLATSKADGATRSTAFEIGAKQDF